MQFPGHPTRSIVIAEDDLDDQEMLRYAFREIDPGLVVICVATGKKLMNHLEHLATGNMPALFILDYNLPEMSGADIMRWLRSNERFGEIPILVWSTSNSPYYKSVCMELGARDYIDKPSDLAAYLSTARHMLSFMIS
ncbi:response regulator [Chitinophaga lutea]